MQFFLILIAMLIGYGFGSLPFGLILVRLAGLGDIRAIGSGSIGATNVLRTGRKDLALATLLLDAGKAGFAYMAGHVIFGYEVGLLAGFAALIGHCYPVWLKFRGGKAVAPYLGLLLFAHWQLGLIFVGFWLLIAMIFRYSSLSVLVAAPIMPITAYCLGYPPILIILLVLLASLIYWRHRVNIKRLLKGQEPRIGQEKIN